jgi:hypothetical protein
MQETKENFCASLDYQTIRAELNAFVELSAAQIAEPRGWDQQETAKTLNARLKHHPLIGNGADRSKWDTRDQFVAARRYVHVFKKKLEKAEAVAVKFKTLSAASREILSSVMSGELFLISCVSDKTQTQMKVGDWDVR